MITTTSDLRSLVAGAHDAGVIGLDTEFVWSRTYFPRLGLVQVSLSASDCRMVDALSLEDWSPLAEVLADPTVVKILHDAPQDLTIIKRVTGVTPSNVFDTRLAAGFAGFPATLSLTDLLQQTLGVTLSDAETRSDWLQRPLTQNQVAYALEDVRHLPQLRELLLEKARELGREGWVAEEMRIYDDPALYEDVDLDTLCDRIKGTQKLTRAGKAALRGLVAWREQEARRKDRPRGRVITDEHIRELAYALPQSRNDIDQLSWRTRNDELRESVLEIIWRALAEPAAPSRGGSRHASNGNRGRDLADRLFAHAQACGEAAGVDPRMVATRADVTALACAAPDPRPEDHRALRGWRKELLGEEFEEILSRGAHRAQQASMSLFDE